MNVKLSIEVGRAVPLLIHQYRATAGRPYKIFHVFSTLKEGVAGGGRRLPIVWIFLLLLNLSDRRGPAALGRGEVPPSAGRGVSETRLCAGGADHGEPL